ncbi:angiopoietin-related protein 3 [Ornithorhynchus anatinus]|uniref:Angiopoietin-related protein 3 n=1 Tax=Ornithorhynchus anatinus TaxID=9258 RepID=F6QXZ1_ORNAN|nr:angiopoietin-related protein 3 [Ornithorhynchus anatinus]
MRTIILFVLFSPFVISSGIDQDYSPFDSPLPDSKSRFAMLDDVKILANGLLQLGHGLKDFVHKTKGQINDIFKKLNIFDQSFYALSEQTNELKVEEEQLRETTSKLQARNEEMKNMSLELNSKLEGLLREKLQLQQKVGGLEEKLANFDKIQPEIQEPKEVISLKSFVERQDSKIKNLLEIVQEQYAQLDKQHNQIKDIEEKLRKTGFQETTDTSFSSKQRAPRTIPSLQFNATRKSEGHGVLADCSAIYDGGEQSSGVYSIRPNESEAFNVYCEVKSDSSWTVIQRRSDGSQNFNETWESYERGFGSLDGEFWLGLEKIYSIVKQGDYILRIELEDWKDNERYVEYSFTLGSKDTDYLLHLSEITGSIPNALPEHRDLAFSTWDHGTGRDFNCPEGASGGWWWENACGETNLNGKYAKPRSKSKPDRRRGLSWKPSRGRSYSLKATKMLIHPTDLGSFE